jgi:hypothetical protein
MQSFDETLDFFSPEGTPLRATVALKLSEDRYQFRQGQARKSDRETPTLGSSGGGGVGDANKQAGKDERAWRDTALYNGLESPRIGAGVGVSVPGASLSASVGASAGISAGLGVGASAKADIAPPGFSFGASASLGTSIPGAFSISVPAAPAAGVSAEVGSGVARARTSVGFD